MADWVSPWWQAAVLPARWRVGGFDLLALSVWHSFALERVGNRFLVGGQPDMDDVASLVLICSRCYLEGKALLWDDKARTREIRRVHRWLKSRPVDELVGACGEYVAACIRTADRWRKLDGGSRAAAVPYQWHLVNLLKAAGVVAAWDTAYAVARCLYDANAEASGDDKIMTETQQRDDDLAAKGAA